jgi:type I restriction enzyme M protein
VAVKKSELYSSLWALCDELRGGMEPAEYKDYVLLLLFVRYVSDKAKAQPDGHIVIPVGGGFDDLVKLKNKPNIGEGVNIAIAKLVSANMIEGITENVDFNDQSKLGNGPALVERLTKLIGIFEDLPNFAKNRADGDDILGDAYEYLMMKFSVESGKSKGQFYTPSEVSRVMSYLIGIDKAKKNTQTILDPTCGSGSLLLKAHDTALTNTGKNLTIYGQELAGNTAALARMNMWLHNILTAEIVSGVSTISDPGHLEQNGDLKTFDYVVANPPFSTTNWKTNVNPPKDPYKRFELGTPPDKNGDYAFLLHIIASLKTTGTGAVILPHGVLFRGNAEAVIRKNLINKGYIKAIVGLPANLFYGTGIPACILVLDKAGAGNRDHIFMIDASKGFIKDGNKNRLRERDIHKILDAFALQADIEKFSRLVPVDEIKSASNDYNLNLPRYVDTSEPEDVQDIDGHIRGGIPNLDIDDLSKYWNLFNSLKPELIKKSNRAGYSALTVKEEEVSPLINKNTEVIKFKSDVHERFEGWKEIATSKLMEIDANTRPKAFVNDLGESLLESFKDEPLIDAYAIYQGFMEYWEEILKDDVYMIVESGWLESAKLNKILPKAKDRVDVQVKKDKYHSETLPANIVVECFFAKEHASVLALEGLLSSTSEALEAFFEEYGDDEGVLKDYFTKGKISKKELSSALMNEGLDKEEKKLLKSYELLLASEVNAKESLSKSTEELASKLLAKYKMLDEKAIKEILVNSKWIAAISRVLSHELERVISTFSMRLTELSFRYLVPLPEIQKNREVLAVMVENHLRNMGVKWE